MKKTKQFITLALTALLIAVGCNKDDNTVAMVDPIQKEDPKDPDKPDETDPPATTGQIVFPEGSTIDLDGASITIAGEVIPLTDNGTVTLPSFPNATELAFLTNKDSQILLVGFISEGQEQLSIASTATVLFYFASTAYLQSEESKTEILASIEENEQYLAFVDELENLFKQDNLVLQNLGFLSALEAHIGNIRNVNTTNSKVSVDSNDIRSKIQVENANSTDNSFTVTNNSPRRAQVFVYKKAFTDNDGNRQIVDELISGGDTAILTEPLFQGRFNSRNYNDVNVGNSNLLNLLNFCGNVFRPTTSEPLALTLEDNEASAEFEVTVIGPGQNKGERNMTSAELDAFERISTETFLLDYVLPTLFDIGGRKEAYDNIEGASKDAALVAAAEPFFQNNPEVRQLVFEGKFNEALQTFFSNIRDNGSVFELMEESYEVVFNNNAISGSFVFTDTLTDNLANMTEILEGVTSKLSFFCTDNSLSNINTLESWELTADRGDVTLEPLRAGVQIFDTDLEITADIAGIEDEELTNGTITYEWSVTENFDSFLFDTQGNNGTSFTNTTNSVGFASFTSGFNLVDFENIETVTVKAFRDTNGTPQQIGVAEMTVNVQDRLYNINPQNAILKGIEQVNLQVQNIDGSPLVENDEFEFKVVWSTSGAHALFNGNSTSETVLNNNSIVLRNLDDEVENAVQSVRAGIFLRPKNNPNDIPFREVTFEFVDVFITNNNTIEFEVNGEGFTYNRFPVETGRRIQLGGGFIIPFDERAISYSAEIINFQLINSFGNDIGARFKGNTYNWTNTSQGEPVGILNDSSDSPGDFGIILIGSGVGINADGAGSDSFAAAVALYAKTVGTAKITIVLGDE